MSQLIHNSIPHSALRISHSRQRRRGISIIEVMTAVVVAMIGVFGTMVLIPFAVKQAQSGLNLDNATALAINSRQNFDAMGFRSRDRWASGLANDVSGVPPALIQRAVLPLPEPYMIDPNWVTRNAHVAGPVSLDHNIGFTLAPDVLNNFGHFGDGVLAVDPDGTKVAAERLLTNGGPAPTMNPFYGQVHPVLPSSLRIQRLSLDNGLGRSALSLLSRQAVDKLLGSGDGVTFDVFDADATGAAGEPLSGRPFQVFDRDATGNILKSQTSGGRLSQAMFLIPDGGAFRRVTLVFSDRVSQLYQNPVGARPTIPAVLGNVNPRSLMASAMVTTRGALPASLRSEIHPSGSEIVLCQVVWPGGGVDPTPNQLFLPVEGDAEAPGVRRDDWVMMLNRLPAGYPVAGVAEHIQMQFFRVTGIDEGDVTGGTPGDLASLTLDGPPFDFGPDGIKLYGAGAVPPRAPTYVIHLRDVVNVFEDTISLN